MLKRTRDGDSEDAASLASYLMLLSGQAEESRRVFTCKTCNREFTSFQALGGHRASHKKPRLMAAVQPPSPPSPPKPKTHDCSICGQEFAIGQALGGHMRRHRDGGGVNDQRPLLLTLSLDPTEKAPVVKNANSRRVLCLDLNLTPLENRIVHFGKA